MKKKNFLGIVLAGAVLVSALSGCGEKQEELEGNYSVSIGWASASLQAVMWVAEDCDLEEGLNLDVEWVDGLTNGPDIVSALAGGSIDVGIVGDFPVVTNFGSGETPVFTVITTTDCAADSALFVPKDSGISTIADLAGKTIGTQIGTGAQYQLETSLASAGLSVDDVTLVNLDVGSWSSAFVNGDVDAVCIMESFTVGNEEIGEITILDRTDFSLRSVLANTEWAAENPEAAARTLVLLYRAIDYINNNEQEALEIVAGHYPDVSEEKILFELENLANNTILAGVDDNSVERYEELKEFAYGAGSISTDFDVADVYDNTYAERAKEIADNLE